MFKKFSRLFMLILVGSLVFVGCSTSVGGNEAESDEFTIGISLFVDHQALTDARDGFIEELENLGVDAKIDVQIAQGEIPNTVSIAEKFAGDKVDLIFAIATPAAQSAKQVTDDIPIVFSAVTDPVDSELIESMDAPGGNITGTSDLAQNMDLQLALFQEIDPTIKRIGIVFNTSEDNSRLQIDAAKKIAKDLGLEIVEVGIDNINNIGQAIDSIVSRIDGIYTITDNLVASSVNVVAEKAIKYNLVTVGAEASHVERGILISDGISYFNLGKQSARMAHKILVEGESPAEIPAEFAEKNAKDINFDTLEALGLDKDMEVFK